MRVLVGCEFSGVVRDAFAARGHDAWSCDLLPSARGGQHYQCDVRDVVHLDWDLFIFHPTCTYLTVAAAWCYYHPDDKHLPESDRRPHPKWPDRKQQQKDSIEFCKWGMGLPIKRIAMENPIGVLSSQYRKPDQIIQPHQFGHDASKSTCLWLNNLPRLKPTLHIAPREVEYPKGSGKIVRRWDNQTDSGQNRLSPSEDRWALRSITYDGIAHAMATQWG